MNRISKDIYLYVFSGLPGSGKSTLAKRLSTELSCAYLRIDTIEQALRDLCDVAVEGEGYRMAYRIAQDNLRQGLSVVADSCNPIRLTRDEWLAVASELGCASITIEVVCSDETEHQHRVESRIVNVPNLVLPTWREVREREYHPWHIDRIVIDTAGVSAEQSFNELLAVLDERG